MAMTTRLLDMLTDFLVTNVEGKAMAGITYAMALKGQDDALIERGKRIKEETKNAGFTNGEVFRAYELSNGYIFDMDVSIAKYITEQLAKKVSREQKIALPVTDLIGNRPEQRRGEDMRRLADYCIKQYKEGKRELELALFSRNNVPKIVITGTATSGNKAVNGKQIVVEYKAFAIRHWDIEDLNRSLLAPYGIMIEQITPCEVLPSKTGVRFILKLAQRV